MLSFSRLRIGSRLAIGFGALLVLLVISTGTALWKLRSVAADSRSVLQIPLMKERLISDWSRNTNVSLRRATAVAKSSDPSLADFFAAENAQTSKDNTILYKQIEPLIAAADEKELIDKLNQYRDKFRITRDAISEAKKKGDAAESNRLLEEVLKPHAKVYMAALQAFLDLQRKNIDATAAEIAATADASERLVLLLAGASLLLSTLLAWLITRSISAPLDATVLALERVAQRDLSVRIDVNPADKHEIARLQLATMRMIGELAGLLRNIRAQADELSGASDQLSAASDGVKAGSEQQSEATASMAAALEEMSTSVSHVAELSGDARRLSQQSGGEARNGAQTMQAMVGEINQIAEAIRDAAATAQQLGRDSEQISSITTAIKGVADQTNLLALNAAIEAARAGEQGRGFAVVADEVRKLAEQASRSAEEIATTIASVQSGVGTMTARMDISVKRVEAGIEMARAAGAIIDAINSGTGQVVSVTGEVAVALGEQSNASQEIAGRVENIVQMIEQNNHAMGAVATTAGRLNTLAGELNQNISRFRVEA
ncbi:MAG TPA: methyl-accepting chemotaxis protein [Burkholderiales bacterium]|jgi:methyl-accepting chemotaxis protein|nr:methyl-accepting chemotaxis protein [Burkholderiales bacterium]